ncbi:MAG: hypothetical protein E2P03_07595 [Acidobacteria bacterium]|nr:MAG: hypothetical protein E2P03_07595 [Acidobacteriota bacterium]
MIITWLSWCPGRAPRSVICSPSRLETQDVKMPTWLRSVLIISLALGCSAAGMAQFSRPKVTYDRFKWQVYHAPHFDIYYYPEEEAFLERMVSFSESAYLKLSEDLDHQLSIRVPLIYYKTHPEFEQTNIILQEIPEAVGAFAEPLQSRMVLPIDGPPDKTYKLILHELTHIFEYDILFNNQLGRTFRANPPLWIMEGLASFLAEDEDSFDQMAIRDAVVNSLVPRIQELGGGFLTYRFGNAVFTFIHERWGMEGVRNFLFEYRKVLLRNNIPKALKEAFGMDIDEFNRQFQKYLRQRYLPYLLEKSEPADYGREIGFQRPGVFTFAPTVSPGGELVAVLANRKLELDLWIVSGSDGAPLRNVTKGFTNKWQYLTTEVFAGKRDLTWSPAGDMVAVFVRKENRRNLVLFNPRTGKRLRIIPMPSLALQASPAFSPDGTVVAFSANVGGVFDIYTYDLVSGEIINRTDDPYVDSNPMWSADGTTLLYNRRINAYEKIFEVMASDPTRKTQLTFGESSDIMPAYARDGRRIYYSSDRGDGIFNLFELDLAGGSERRLTDIMTGVFAPVELDTLGDKNVVVFTAYFRGRYRLYRMELGPPEEEIPLSSRDLSTVELQPFTPPLQLTLDEDQKEKYKRSYQVESPGLEVGVTDNGTFFGNTALTLADLMGDKRWIFAVSTVSSYSNLDVLHVDYSRRTNFIYHVYQHEDFFFFPRRLPGGFVEIEIAKQRFSGGSFSIQYPFNRHYGFDASLGLTDASVPVVETAFDSNGNSFTRLEDVDYRSVDLGFFFTADTTRWQSWGPHHGQRFRIGAVASPEIGGEGGDLVTYQVDYRKYFKITRRSSFAMRTVGIISSAENTEFRRTYSIGGLNQLRGFGYRDYRGDRVFFQNFEFRLPLVDQLRFPFGGSIRDIRAVLFMDIGGAYYEGGEWYDPIEEVFIAKIPKGQDRCSATGFMDTFQRCREGWEFSKGGELQNGVASFGVGLNMRLGFLELNWVFAKQTNFSETIGPWRSAFYIGNKF